MEQGRNFKADRGVGQETIQKQLQECKRNQTVYEEVAKEMREAGYERTYQQLLKTDYSNYQCEDSCVTH